MTDILVTYGSKYGATREIAERIGQHLRAQGLSVETCAAGEVHDLSGYNAVIVGSAVYAGQWRAEVVQLLEKQSATLAHKPVWLFSTGPTGEGDATELMKGYRYPDALKNTIEQIQARDIAFFHGAIDMNKLNFAERLIIKGMKVAVGDFRNWHIIEEWTKQIAHSMQEMTR